MKKLILSSIVLILINGAPSTVFGLSVSERSRVINNTLYYDPCYQEVLGDGYSSQECADIAKYTEEQEQEFRSNHLSEGGVEDNGNSSSSSVGDLVLNSNQKILLGKISSAEISSIKNGSVGHIASYKVAASLSNLPWELFAFIHYRESSFSMINPPKSDEGICQGVLGLYSLSDCNVFKPQAKITEEDLLFQLKKAASFIVSDKSNGLALNGNSTSLEVLKEIAHRYNSGSSAYKTLNSPIIKNNCPDTNLNSLKNHDYNPYVSSKSGECFSKIRLFTEDNNLRKTAVDERPGLIAFLSLIK